MRYQIRNPFSDRLEGAVALTRRRSVFFRYGLAIIICLVATLIFIGAKSVIGTTSPFLFLTGGILLVSLFGGLRPGLLTFFYSLILAWIVFIQPNIAGSSAIMIRTVFQTVIFLTLSPLILTLIHRRNKTYEQMLERTAQQAVIATIGQYGLEESDLVSFMNRVSRAIAKTLGVEYCKVLELLPDGKALRVRAGVGWKKGVVGRAIVDAGKESQAGFTLRTNRPVIVTNLTNERRFSGTPLLHEHGVSSGISVVIPGMPRPYGILSVHTQKQRKFTKDDLHFLTALANLLAATIERRADRQELQLMATLNSELVTSLDPQETLSSVVNTLVPRFADICEVYIKQESSRPHLVEIKAISKEKERIFKELGEKYPPIDESKRPTAQVLRSGKPLLQSVLPDSHAKDISIDEGQEKLFRQLRLISTMVMPIKIRHKTIGTIGFGSFDKGRIFTERDFLTAKEIADRVAVAVDNANLYQEAKNAIQARDEFLSIASHELKTPLTSMLLQLQTVLHSMKSESLANFSIEKTMVMLESTISQSKRLSKLVNDLLNISLITTGRLELEREKTDLSKIVHDVSGRLKEQAEKSGSPIVIEGEKSLVGRWDRVRLEQVVTNLLTNAIKYGDGKQINVELHNSHKQATLKVMDRGLGIPQSQQDRIFDRFQRGEVKRTIKGLGVGLYLVNEIVRAHGGKVLVNSKPKEGSTFTVQLPL